MLSGGAAYADPITDLLTALGLSGLLKGDNGTIEARALTPPGTSQDDLAGLDLSNSESSAALTLGNTPLLGFGSENMIALDALGVDQLLTALGLGQDSELAGQLRALVGPEGAIIVPVVDSVESAVAMLQSGGFQLADAVALPGMSDQPVGLSVLGEADGGNATADGLAGIALLTDGASGTGGLIGLAVLAGDGAGTGSTAGVAVLSGDNAGSGDTAGISILSGSNAGNSNMLSLAVLNGDSAGNTGSDGVAAIGALNGDNSGNGGFAGVGALNGDNSGNASGASVGVLNGDNSGSGDAAAAGVLNGSTPAGSGLLLVDALNEGGARNNNDGNTDCTNGVACNDDNAPSELDGTGTCSDGDADGVCDAHDSCGNTPAGKVVYVTGCHLASHQPLILRGVNFEFDSTELTAPSLPLLQRAREIIASEPDVRVAIDGHTDSKGSDAYNHRLSRHRAAAIYRYLVASGIEPDRLVYRGFGESKPVAANTGSDGSDNPEGRASNRRVELTVVEQALFENIREDVATIER